MNLEPLPLEEELRIALLRRSLSQLSREELESLLGDYIDKLTRLTHHTTQLMRELRKNG